LRPGGKILHRWAESKSPHLQQREADPHIRKEVAPQTTGRPKPLGGWSFDPAVEVLLIPASAMRFEAQFRATGIAFQ